MAADRGAGKFLGMIERRFSPSGTITPTMAKSRTVRGYAAVFNKRSENLGTPANPVFEFITPGAFDDVLKDDVRALFNHDANLILARSKAGKGTLKIGIDATGLWYEFEAPATGTGNDLLVLIRRGDISQSSFGFTVAKGGDAWTTDGAARVRRIRKISKLLDVSPVAYPAYPDANVGTRGTAPAATSITTPIHAAIAARLGIF